MLPEHVPGCQRPISASLRQGPGSGWRALNWFGQAPGRERTQWKAGWGLVAEHQSEARRGITKTTLPWGLLASHFSTPLPRTPTHTLSRDTLLWGLAASVTSVANGRQVWRILPGGLLFRSTAAPGKRAVHLLGTGLSHTDATTCFRLFCIPLRTTQSPQSTAHGPQGAGSVGEGMLAAEFGAGRRVRRAN
jgi:hypothetical protein